MQTVVFDIETNAVEDFTTLEGLTDLHCIALSDGTGVKLFTSEEGNIEKGLKILRDATTLVGHNIQGFDVPALQILYPDWEPKGSIRDTLLLVRLMCPDIRDKDYKLDGFPKKHTGRNTLAAWGHRLDIHKSDLGSDNDWSLFTDEMGEYCKRDVEVTVALWKHLKELGIPQQAAELEHEFAEIIRRQEALGMGFDSELAGELYSKLVERKLEIEGQFQEEIPPQIIKMKKPTHYEDPTTGDRFILKSEAPAKIRKTLVAGPLKVKRIPFNPGSRQQIANIFIDKYNWEPEHYTGDGRARIDEAVLSSLPYPEASLLAEYLMLIKRLGQLGDGKESWMKLHKNDRIHGRVNTNGAVTGRCTHSKPNMAQVPATGAPWGHECRSLFRASSDRILVGADASGLELRCLAHYMARWDNGEYADRILNGDIHTANQKAAGLPTRSMAKNFIYALIYGAGTPKIGAIIGGDARDGSILKKRFFKSFPAIMFLRNSIDKIVEERGTLKGLDGRKLHVRSAHSALNTLLQSAGAVLMKKATVIAHELFEERGLSATQVAHVHDEIQFECLIDEADAVGEAVKDAIVLAGEHFDLRCPLNGDYKVGHTWADTH